MVASASNIYTMESANMICGNSGNKTAPGITTHLVLQELKLPGLEESYVDHNAAGASVGIEINTHINKLEATFNLAGWDPDVMVYFGREEFRYHQFTAYGLIRDRRLGSALGAYAKFQGRLGRVNPTAFSKGNLMAHEYSIKSIVHYELWMQEKSGTQMREIYFWDFFTSERRVDKVDQNKEMVDLLHIPGVLV
jgi:phage tail tube protein FII